MWYHSDVALAMHRARAAELASRPRRRREGRRAPAALRVNVATAPVPWAR